MLSFPHMNKALTADMRAEMWSLGKEGVRAKYMGMLDYFLFWADRAGNGLPEDERGKDRAVNRYLTRADEVVSAMIEAGLFEWRFR